MNILFISAFDTPFIQDDLVFLSKRHSVRKEIGHGLIPASKIFFRMFGADVVYCWFASTYAFIGVALAKLLSVTSVVIIGGVDVANDETLGYGIWLSRWRSTFVRYVFRNATHILIVDPSMKERAKMLAGYDGKNISYVPTGYDSTFWKPLDEKAPVILTVAVVRDVRTLKVKGIDLLIDAARVLPDVQFIVVGTDPQIALPLMPPLNIKFYLPMRREDLLPFYRQALVYCQPSRHEGLSNALAEAMLCGCIPVATEVGGNPTAVGQTGFLIPPDDANALAVALREALTADKHFGMEARARIVALFPKEKREIELMRFIHGNKG